MANTSYHPEITSFESSSQPTTSIVRVNTLWLVGLVLSLMASLFCIFVKQWVRMYMKWAEVTPLQTAMALRQYRYNGLQKWGLPAALAIMPGILQLALALFLVGLVELLLPIHHIVGVVTAVVVYGFLGIAVFLTLLPLVWRTSPFKTPVIETVLPIIYKMTWPCILLIRSIILWYSNGVYDGRNLQISSYIVYLESLAFDLGLLEMARCSSSEKLGEESITSIERKRDWASLLLYSERGHPVQDPSLPGVLEPLASEASKCLAGDCGSSRCQYRLMAITC
jgi:hypothetical protein